MANFHKTQFLVLLFFTALASCLSLDSGSESTQVSKQAMSADADEVALLQHSAAIHHGRMALHAKSSHTFEGNKPSTLFSSAQRSVHYRPSLGEFHSTYVKRQEATESFNSVKCKNFYNLERSAGPMIVDDITQTFRPASEVLGRYDSIRDRASLPMVPARRMFTFEDIAFPKDFHEPQHRDSWCEMFAVRTPQRPVKVLSATSPNGTKLMMPAIWKCASTSLTQMLSDAQKERHSASSVFGPHDTKDQCEPPNLLAQCEKHTSFDSSAVTADVRAAFVRSPLDRFLASVYEHGEWESCSGGVCEWMVATAQDKAARLVHEFPHRWRSCVHPSQAYFLSATDVNGNPFSWDLIARLEEFQSGLDKLHVLWGVVLEEKERNSGGDKQLKHMYFDAVFNDTRTLCSICKVYAQDFECFGYAKPDRCTPEQCSAYGISLD